MSPQAAGVAGAFIIIEAHLFPQMCVRLTTEKFTFPHICSCIKAPSNLLA